MPVPVRRIGIAGAGVSGLALAGILSTKLGKRVCIDVLERGAKDRDQGYGLDLDAQGQTALKQAGVFHRFWEISRPYSDVMMFHNLRSAEPSAVAFCPKWLGRLFPARFPPQPESSRTLLRQILLDKLCENGNASVRFECPVAGIRPGPNDSAGPVAGIRPGPSVGQVSTAQLVDAQGGVLGEYDLVVDAAGVYSPLRHLRVRDEGVNPDGRVLVHGVINDPEASAPRELVERLGQGSLFLTGRGYQMCFQRFGAAIEDRRTAFFYFIWRDNMHKLWKELNMSKSTSRADGFLVGDRLACVKQWLHADMATHFDAVYHDSVDALDRVTVRPILTHTGTHELLPPSALPLVCIGDSLKNIGVGGGGNMALEDALDLGTLLVDAHAWWGGGAANSTTSHSTDAANSSASYPAGLDHASLAGLEAKMLARKVEFDKSRAGGIAFTRDRPTDGSDPSASIADMFGSSLMGRAMGHVVSAAAALSVRMYNREKRLGQLGSAPPPK